MKYFLTLFCFTLMLLLYSTNASHAQLTFNNGLTAQQLAQSLAGPGITVTNATFTCPTNGIGSFAGGGSTNIGLSTGIILTTGPNTIALGPNNNAAAGVCASPPYPGDTATGDPDLAPLAGAQTYDACKLEFDVIPLCDTVKFNYVFASEEYPEYVCSGYNDAFAFFISGPGISGQQNIALIPNTSIPVAINSVNGGTVGSNGTNGGCTSLGYSQYYVDNAGGNTIQYDGFTTVLTAKSAVQPCQTYHLKITIADAGDCAYDSGLLMQAGSLQCQPVLSAGPDTTLCSGEIVTIGMPPVTGATYSWTPATGLSNPNSSNPLVTGTNTGSSPVTTTYILTATSGSCVATDTVAVTINPMPSVNAGPNQATCNSSWVQLTGTIGGGVTGAIWSGGTGSFFPYNTNLNTTYTPSAAELDGGAVTLVLTTNDPAGPCPAAVDSVVVLFNAGTVVSAWADQIICTGSTVTLAGFVGGTVTSGTWSGGAGTYTPNDTTLNAVYTPTAAEAAADSLILTLTSSDPQGPCTAVSDQMKITINHLPTANAGSAQYGCSGSGITLAGAIGGAATSGTWTGGAGMYSPDNTALNAVYTADSTEFAAGSVTLTLTTDDPLGPCTFSSSTVTFYFYKIPVVDFSSDSAAGCKIHCPNFTDLTTISGTDSIVSWTWDFGDGSTGSTLKNPSHCFPETGYYDVKLIATSNRGCVSSLTKIKFIRVFANPGAAFTPTPNPASIVDPTITFNNQSSTDVNYWHWNFGDNTTLAPNTSSPVHEYSGADTSSYLVTLIVRNADGCYDTVAHQIFIGPAFTFYIPNFFSPNADGINDYFFGKGMGIKKYDLRIFDRWGDMIFHGNTINDKWDGKANGASTMAQIDVYVWKVELTDVFSKRHDYIGTVTLVK